jgi:hypothetical protein
MFGRGHRADAASRGGGGVRRPPAGAIAPRAVVLAARRLAHGLAAELVPNRIPARLTTKLVPTWLAHGIPAGFAAELVPTRLSRRIP